MENKKIPYVNLIPILIISFLIFKVINDGYTISWILTILSPIFGAFAIAYLLEPIISYLERQFKLRRGVSVLITYLLILGIIIFIIYIVTPNIANNIADLIPNISGYFRITQDFIQNKIYEIDFLKEYGIIDYLESSTSTIFEELSIVIKTSLNEFLKQAINITSGVFKIILSMTIAVYMLLDKYRFRVTSKRLLYAVFEKNKADKIMSLVIETNDIFSRYLVGKLLDSFIIGILCYLILSIIDIKYALLISVIVGITNMIPYFGPFIGAIPAVFITLFSSPVKALYVAIAILVLQQFDGLYLGPKILGEKVGIRPFWIITAITIGGGMFGVLGMLLAVPVVAVIKAIFDRYVEKRLKEKNIIIKY